MCISINNAQFNRTFRCHCNNRNSTVCPLTKCSNSESIKVQSLGAKKRCRVNYWPVSPTCNSHV